LAPLPSQIEVFNFRPFLANKSKQIHHFVPPGDSFLLASLSILLMHHNFPTFQQTFFLHLNFFASTLFAVVLKTFEATFEIEKFEAH